MFWGLIMEPNKRYTQTVEKPFHISQAAMDISTGDNDPCQVMVVVDQKNFLICTLQKGKAIQVPLDLYFKAGASVAFLTNGKCNVHLTGYLDPEFEDDESEGDEEAEEEEEEEAAAPTLVMAKNKRKLDNSTDAVATKKAKKQANKKAAAEEGSDSSDEDVDNTLQKFLTDDIDSDENDESFKANTSGEPDSDEEDSDDDEVEEEENDDDEDDDEKDEEEDSKAETTLDSSLDTSKDEKKLSKSQKRRLKKKEKQQQAQVNGVDKAKKSEKSDVQQKKAEKKQQEGKKQKDPEVKTGEKKEKKTLTGGVYIEDLKVGDGPVAKSGKTVQVYYEGRLKQNNKMFDNCNKGAGFKFRLGSKEVITGWDVGVAGMKVGGKRKIVCPPAMAYGAKGSPPVIPPNSTLVFEVELKNVK